MMKNKTGKDPQRSKFQQKLHEKLRPEVKEQLTKKASDQEVKAYRRKEREALLNKKKETPEPPPKSITYDIVERVAMATLDNFRAATNRGIEIAESRKETPIKHNPDNNKHYKLKGIELFVRLEEFDIKGQQLIDRFKFNPKSIRASQTFHAFQLAVFKESIVQEVDPKTGTTVSAGDISSIDLDLAKATTLTSYPRTKGESYTADKYAKTADELYADPKMSVVYHAFYPIVGPGESVATAKLELWQGLLNTMVSWGFYHQETMESRLTERKVEEDRQKIQEKVEEFNKLVDFEPEDNV